VSCSLDDVTSSISIHWYQTGIAMADIIKYWCQHSIALTIMTQNIHILYPIFDKTVIRKKTHWSTAIKILHTVSNLIP